MNALLTRISFGGSLRGASWAASVACGTYGTLQIRESWANFDGAMVWYAAALASLFAATWSAPSCGTGEAPRRGLLGGRWVLLGFLGVMGAALFMRLYDLGSFPPPDGLAFEEAQTGGEAYGVLHEGLRPIDFPVVAYLSASGFMLFDDGTLSLRLPFVVLGVASVGLFYLLMREMVSARAALFSAALFAASRWLVIGSRTADELFSGVAFEIAALYFLARGLRTGRSWNFVFAGLASGVLMYEYSSYRVLPLLFPLFLALLTARRLRGPLSSLVRRGVEALRQYWQPALALLISFGVAFGPLLVTSLKGERQFGYEAFERDTAVRQGSLMKGLLPPGWEDRLEWGIEVFTRGAEASYAPLGKAGESLVDPVTSVLLVAAIASAVVFFRRPFRLLFLVWFLGITLGGSVVPINFNAGRLTAGLPGAFALIGFLVDDCGALMARWKWRARGGLWIALVPIAALALALNAYSLFAVHARDREVQLHYVDRLFFPCHFLKGQEGSYAYVWSEDGTNDPIFVRSGYSWACDGVQGEDLASLADLWGLGRDRSGDALLVFSGTPPKPDVLRPLLALAAPGFHWSEETALGPGGQPLLHLYRLPASVQSQYRGLVGTYYAGTHPEGTPLMRRIDAVMDQEVAGPTLDGDAPYTVTWEGLIYVPVAGIGGLRASTGNDLRIELDGQAVLPASLSQAAATEPAVGWHTIRMTLTVERPEHAFRLFWLGPTGERRVRSEELFPLSPLKGLQYQRRFADPARAQVTLAGVGWPISFTASGAAARRAQEELGVKGLRYVGETWNGFVLVDGEEPLRLMLEAKGGAASLDIDGRPVLEASSATSDVAQAADTFLLSLGRHSITLRFDNLSGGLVGARLFAGPGPEPTVKLDMFEPH